MLDLLVPLLVTVTGPAVVALVVWSMSRASVAPGHRVTVSLTDGSVLTGRTRATWPGRIRLVDVATDEGDVPGSVVVNGQHVVTVQVIS